MTDDQLGALQDALNANEYILYNVSRLKFDSTIIKIRATMKVENILRSQTIMYAGKNRVAQDRIVSEFLQLESTLEALFEHMGSHRTMNLIRWHVLRGIFKYIAEMVQCPLLEDELKSSTFSGVDVRKWEEP